MSMRVMQRDSGEWVRVMGTMGNGYGWCDGVWVAMMVNDVGYDGVRWVMGDDGATATGHGVCVCVGWVWAGGLWRWCDDMGNDARWITMGRGAMVTGLWVRWYGATGDDEDDGERAGGRVCAGVCAGRWDGGTTNAAGLGDGSDAVMRRMCDVGCGMQCRRVARGC